MSRSVAVIGGGPAGLMAAEVLSLHGVRVDVYDAMPSVGRKFLMAGKGGMNITHAEPLQDFLNRYGARREQIQPLLDAFSPDALREWIHGLGIDTFVGSSGRVFPTDMKAAPLLRAWLHRLRENGVSFHMRHRWIGWNTAGELCFETPEGERTVQIATHLPLPNPLCADGTSLALPVTATSSRPAPEGLVPLAGEGTNEKVIELNCSLASNPLQLPLDRGRAKSAPPLLEVGSQQSCGVPTSIPLAGARGGWEGFGSDGLPGINHVHAVVLALGGGSWPQLGSTGAWVPLLAERGVEVAPLRAANCGFDAGWSEHFRTRFAGHPLKGVVLSFTDVAGSIHRKQGDIMVTASGIEGGLVYALSATLRDEIEVQGFATIYLDLTPGKNFARIQAEAEHPRGSRSLSSHLQSRVGLNALQIALLRECLSSADFSDPAKLAQGIKAMPIKLISPRPLSEVISTAGGVMFEVLDQNLMLKKLPGIFCAGEMLDWEAPTGGYLLTACFASGKVAGAGVLDSLKKHL